MLPGAVGRCDRGWAQIACADEWVEVRRLKVDCASFLPGEILKPGDTLQDGI